MLRRAFLFMGLVVLLTADAAIGQATIAPDRPPAKEPIIARERGPDGEVLGPGRVGWWNDAVFYEVFVRSFQDSTAGPLAGDGVGDLRGLVERLDYLNDGDPATTQDLGVTGLWLMPINASPSYHGYDVTDYRAVSPHYGTMDDFRRLVSECHKRGIRVIIDLVLNHCSSKHPWFVSALEPASDKRDWFIWSEADPEWRGPWNQRVWHRATGEPARWFYGLFGSGMPDLNYRNERVSAEMLRVARFWIDREQKIGADGYRLDAVRHLIEEGTTQDNTPQTHEWLRRLGSECKTANPEAVTIGEIWAPTDVAASYVGAEMDMAFEFDLAAAMVQAAKSGKAKPLIDAQANVLRHFPPNQYGRFLTNHDQPRVMTQLGGDEGPARVAAAMLLLGPGVPFIYYGEEIGMTGNKPDENIRTPMQWGGKSAAKGFSSGKPWRQANADALHRNVEEQTSQRTSLLSLYRDLIRLRGGDRALSAGAFWPVTCSDEGVYAFVRGNVDGAGARLVVINLSPNEVGGCALSALTSPLFGRCKAVRVRWGEDTEIETNTPSLAAQASGAFAGFVPTAKLRPHGVAVFRFDNVP